MKNLEKLIRPDFQELKAYSSARDEFEGQASVFLDANENPFENEVNRYPDPLQKTLKAKIAQIKSVELNSILLGNGSDECIDLIIRLFCVPFVDEITAIAPSYGMYAVSSKINGVKLRQVNLNDDFSMDVEKILEQSRSSKLLFLCSPNNPTGKSFPKEQLLNLVEKFDGIVVIDEAYIDFSEEESFNQLTDEYENLIVIQTFSKAYGMAGIRLGMLFANPEIIKFLNKIKPPYNINILTQKFALDQLENYDKILRNIQEIKNEREELLKVLKEINSIKDVFPSDSNFILIRIKDADFVYQKLISKGIVVRNRSKEILCDSCLRITVGTTEENQKLINELKNIEK